MDALKIIREFLPPGTKCALLLYRGGVSNIGDAAIQVGQHILIEKLKLKVRYAARLDEYSYTATKKAIGNDGVILISGGGSMGDFHKKAQDFKETVARSFPENRIFILPQSVIFNDLKSIEKARSALSSHENLYVFARDEESLKTAQEQLQLKSILVPDMALLINVDKYKQSKNNKNSVLLLLRTDKEKKFSDRDIEKLEEFGDLNDWPHYEDYTLWETGAWKTMKAIHNYAAWLSNHRVPFTFKFQWLMKKKLSYHRLQKGFELLQIYNVVVTDRLHGLVLGRMLDKHVVVIDNKTSKVRKFYDTWYAEDSKASMVENIDEAVNLLKEMN